MNILLYEFRAIEERVSRSLRVWKAWHIIIYALIGVFGILNIASIEILSQMVEHNCVLSPKSLQFHYVEFITYGKDTSISNMSSISTNLLNSNETEVQDQSLTAENDTKVIKLNENLPNNTNDFLVLTTVDNMTTLTENRTLRLMLDTEKSVFGNERNCEYALYVPIVSSVFAFIWLIMFAVCSRGGKVNSGLQQPWRILAPALLFALVCVAITGHSFAITNTGLQVFCAAFYDVTNSTTCSSVTPFVMGALNSSWSWGCAAGVTRAASAGVWASWACAAALLMARCLMAPDFQVRKTGVFLKSDPHNKIIPHLRKQTQKPNLTVKNSPGDVAGQRSPQPSTELVSATVEKVPQAGRFSSSKRSSNEEIELTSSVISRQNN